ncbi:hypothetical protein FIBSPDRAFT_873317 [Athelia psychrophila]|uniref:Uncharacterized protein n=1 Tax=Athelia psychrophila TaxID=1759441 RepID=A0A165YND8_9AGAM|nr:hypothetical protein FIBSPDRAFT_873317 [Fibularhizoctonia sp. CBS 109695]
MHALAKPACLPAAGSRARTHTHTHTPSQHMCPTRQLPSPCASPLAGRHACLHHTQLRCPRSAVHPICLHAHTCNQASYLPSVHPGVQARELARVCV